jgi:hypothetical protein
MTELQAVGGREASMFRRELIIVLCIPVIFTIGTILHTLAFHEPGVSNRYYVLISGVYIET